MHWCGSSWEYVIATNTPSSCCKRKQCSNSTHQKPWTAQCLMTPAYLSVTPEVKHAEAQFVWYHQGHLSHIALWKPPKRCGCNATPNDEWCCHNHLDGRYVALRGSCIWEDCISTRCPRVVRYVIRFYLLAKAGFLYIPVKYTSQNKILWCQIWYSQLWENTIIG